MIQPEKLILKFEYPEAKIEIHLNSIYFREANALFKKITEMLGEKNE